MSTDELTDYDELKEWIFENIPDYICPEFSFAKFIFPVIGNAPDAPDFIATMIDVQALLEPPASVFYMEYTRDL